MGAILIQHIIQLKEERVYFGLQLQRARVTHDGEDKGTGKEGIMGEEESWLINLHLYLEMGIRVARCIRVSALTPGGHTSST